MIILVPVLSGLFLALAAFFPNLLFGSLALAAIAPTLALVINQTIHKRYITGLLFFGSWLIPTTYWYYLIFPWWQAAAQSLGWVALMAAIFVLPELLRVRKTLVQLLIIGATWTLIDTLRQYLPITEDWWIPHVGYAVWQNSLVVQAARVAGVGGVIAVVVGCNSVLAYLSTRVTQAFSAAADPPAGGRPDKTTAASGIRSKDLSYMPIMSALFIFLISTTGSLIIKKISIGKTPVTLIALQQQPAGGIHASANAEDVQTLIQQSKQALQKISRDKPIFVVWPENMITTESTEIIYNFVRQEKITLAYNLAVTDRYLTLPDTHYSDPTIARPLNTITLLDETGVQPILSFKKHAAPGEQITVRDVSTKIILSNLRVTGDICYDLHYPDIGDRIKNTDLVLGSIDDDRFGRLVPLLHAADIVFRAAEYHTNILVAGTTGPTFFVNRLGVIKHELLPIGKNDVLVTTASL